MESRRITQIAVAAVGYWNGLTHYEETKCEDRMSLFALDNFGCAWRMLGDADGYVGNARWAALPPLPAEHVWISAPVVEDAL
jgi:hypothetical protein